MEMMMMNQRDQQQKQHHIIPNQFSRKSPIFGYMIRTGEAHSIPEVSPGVHEILIKDLTNIVNGEHITVYLLPCKILRFAQSMACICCIENEVSKNDDVGSAQSGKKNEKNVEIKGFIDHMRKSITFVVYGVSFIRLRIAELRKSEAMPLFRHLDDQSITEGHHSSNSGELSNTMQHMRYDFQKLETIVHCLDQYHKYKKSKAYFVKELYPVINEMQNSITKLMKNLNTVKGILSLSMSDLSHQVIQISKDHPQKNVSNQNYEFLRWSRHMISRCQNELCHPLFLTYNILLSFYNLDSHNYNEAKKTLMNQQATLFDLKIKIKGLLQSIQDRAIDQIFDCSDLEKKERKQLNIEIESMIQSLDLIK